ncbi:MAG: 23S rRNA (adenine(2503)-C(2))-methyltransferase RlmN [Anaerolineae bacterium]
MIYLHDLTLDDLTTRVKDWGFPGYRARQIWRWLYVQKVNDFEAMNNLPKEMINRLKEEAQIQSLEPVRELFSVDGQTAKWLFKLPDGQLIETVLMDYSDGRHTACISSQAGCAMGCVFCATGQMGFARNLRVGEILEQVLFVARWLETRGERLSNIVFMGMGEPLHNYDAVLAAVRRIIAPEGLGIGQRHVTVSTVGLVPQIRRFADEGLQVKLAISLHAATDTERGALIPINRRYKIADLLDACRYYIERTGRRITFEWALIAGENDVPEQAHALGRLLEGMLCHVNLIPLNPTNGYGGQPSDQQRVAAFQAILGSYGVRSTVRVRRGIDINAGCGQLKAEVLGL